MTGAYASPLLRGEGDTKCQRTREHTVKKLGLHCLPADEGYSTLHNSYPHPRSSCQGFPASKGTRELLPTRIIHSPFQNTTCGDLPRLWRAASHRVHSHTVLTCACGYSCTCPAASTSSCLRTPWLPLQQPREHQALLQQMKMTTQSMPQTTCSTVVTHVWDALALAFIFVKCLLDSPWSVRVSKHRWVLLWFGLWAKSLLTARLRKW